MRMRISVRTITLVGLLGAVSILLGSTPLGFIPAPTPAGSATIMHLPVILGAVAAGPLGGALVGLVFGLFSLFRATIPLFADPLVAVLPRILIGLVAAWVFPGALSLAAVLARQFPRLDRLQLTIALAITAVIGSLTNTVGVLGMAVWRGYFAAGAALTVAVLQGLPEAVVAAIVLVPVGLALKRAGFIRARE
jgi:uncharacterized membrane protein